jgi:hypothetical protein
MAKFDRLQLPPVIAPHAQRDDNGGRVIRTPGTYLA